VGGWTFRNSLTTPAQSFRTSSGNLATFTVSFAPKCCGFLATPTNISPCAFSVTYGIGELDALVPAYAASIHKSQGSEYPAVVIPVITQHYAMLQRNLLYTGVTRGKRLVVLVGQKKAIAIAVRNVSGRRRWSKLQEWLRPSPSLSPPTNILAVATRPTKV
jgi:hypothetical protein